jgi:4-phytase/acid phosphatase
MSGTTVPVHSFQIADPTTGATMVTDPVFDPVKAGFATVDPDRALAEVLGVYGSGAALASAYASELALISYVLYPSGIVAPGKVDPTNQTTNPFTLLAISPVPAAGESINGGGLSKTINATDPFTMQYSDNFALSDVAWGRLTPATLSQVTRLNVLQFNIEMRMPYVNQVQSSNAASHVLRSMIQFLSNTNIRGAFGDRKSRVVVAVSSDGYVAGLAGLLGVHWTLPGYQTDFCAPGGALVFELRQNNRTKQYVVRVYYTAQTFDQLRGLTTLSIDTPPATQQLMVPGGSTSSTDLDIPWPTFRKILTEAIGQKYVQPFMRDVPPGVLNNVPLE